MQTPPLWQQLPANGRLFIRFWGGCLTATAVLALALQIMGPPHLIAGGDDIDTVAEPGSKTASAAHLVNIPPPQASLLEKNVGPGGFPLPKRGLHGALPRQVYAAPTVDVPPGAPMVALLVDGVGQSEDLTKDAIAALPGQVSLAVSPYVADPDAIMDAARQHQHELLLSLPMQGEAGKTGDAGKDGATDSEGPKALGVLLSTQQNMDNLNWSLSHLAGYVGVTNAFDGQNGGGFSSSNGFKSILSALDQRGLLYLNASPDTHIDSSNAVGTADVSINTDEDIVNIDIQLLKLQQLARQNGRAIGVLGPLRPVALACLRAWLPHLKDVGITLVPVSQLIQPPDPASLPQPASNGQMHVNLSNPAPRMMGGQH
ncbi:divergent polysaccharide deacetylase family protein [Acetobacter sp. LMG 32666]|uniref:divergent polysaccharide deacetylase family protein n=1 Tax=Acetobacter sp. LMG 32666 TaxID=2959295 RepID=UPI0030C8C5A4